MKRTGVMVLLMGLAACTLQEGPPTLPAVGETPWTPLPPAPVDENGLSPHNPPDIMVDAQREQTTLDKLPGNILPAPDSPDHPFPELDDTALEGLRQLFKATPGIEKDDASMAACVNRCCLYHYPRALRYLLAQGINPNGRDAEGRTPLDYAHYHEWREGIHLLHAHGATEHTPGRTFTQKEALFLKHRCPKQHSEAGIPIIRSPFFIWNDPGPDGPGGGVICTACGARE